MGISHFNDRIPLQPWASCSRMCPKTQCHSAHGAFRKLVDPWLIDYLRARGRKIEFSMTGGMKSIREVCRQSEGATV